MKSRVKAHALVQNCISQIKSEVQETFRASSKLDKPHEYHNLTSFVIESRSAAQTHNVPLYRTTIRPTEVFFLDLESDQANTTQTFGSSWSWNVWMLLELQSGQTNNPFQCFDFLGVGTQRTFL
jgi:hypothetical protein